jgi:hypothetical protein
MDRPSSSTPELLRCLECRQPWTNKQDRWHAFIAEPEEYDGLTIGVREVGVFCPACSMREFGKGGR